MLSVFLTDSLGSGLDAGIGVATGRGSGTLPFSGFGAAENFIRERLSATTQTKSTVAEILRMLSRRIQSPYLRSLESGGVTRGPTPPGDMRAEAMWQQHCSWRILVNSTADQVCE